MKTVLNYEPIDRQATPMFLGEPLGLQRYDQMKYPIFFTLAKNMESFFWRAEEVSLLKDRGDYKKLSEAERFVFDSNLRWQTATDALLNRSIIRMQEYVSLPELEAALGAWSFFESNIHSRSYSWILQNVYPNETVFWDSILADDEIKGRMNSIKASYDALFTDDDTDVRQRIFNSVVNTNAVEGLSFYVSFGCSFYFAAHGKMEGNGKIIRLIERDEALHVAVTTNILQNMRDRPDEGFADIYRENTERIRECFYLTAQQEKAWADYIFSKGNLIGLNPKIMHKFIEYVCNQRTRALDLQPLFAEQRKHPLGSWYEQYRDSRKLQSAPQETELSSYLIGGRNTEIRHRELRGLL